MNRIERHGCRYSKLLTCVLALLALTIMWPDSALSQWTQSDASGNINNTNSGNVGVGTTTPQSKLQIGTLTSTATAAPDTLSLGGTFSNSAAQHLKLRLYDDGAYVFGIGVSLGQQEYFVPLSSGNHVFYAGASPLMTIKGTGQVGIGTTTPTAKLDVAGNVNATGTITGDNIIAKYQDVAEWVPALHAIPAGTVVVLNPAKSNQVMASAQAYDTRVAGVVSERPGLALGEGGIDKLLVATTGRVKVKVDASRAPIHIGDLLVTSDVEGVAMKSEPLMIQGRPFHSPGTLIGKALESLEKGTGEILVLLSLQ